MNAHSQSDFRHCAGSNFSFGLRSYSVRCFRFYHFHQAVENEFEPLPIFDQFSVYSTKFTLFSRIYNHFYTFRSLKKEQVLSFSTACFHAVHLRNCGNNSTPCQKIYVHKLSCEVLGARRGKFYDYCDCELWLLHQDINFHSPPPLPFQQIYMIHL